MATTAIFFIKGHYIRYHENLPLGHTGVQVSALCLGAMNYGTKRMPGLHADAGRYVEAAAAHRHGEHVRGMVGW